MATFYAEFQSTRPRGARRGHGNHVHRGGNRFNPRARVGRDEKIKGVEKGYTKFQSTRPRGARRWARRTVSRLSGFQSTRPRGARLDGLLPAGLPSSVSIHAPAWGATWRPRDGDENKRSFNPRARVGRDGRYTKGMDRSSRFNPRARVGRDYSPDRGPTSTRSFNPRARVGRDRLHRGTSPSLVMFQSTRPRGARRTRRGRPSGFRSGFNPRARVGRD